MSQLVYNKAFDAEKHPKDIESFIEHFIELGSPEAAVLVLPTNKYVKWAKKQFCKKYFKITNKPIPELNIFRLQDFAKKCLDEVVFPNKYRLLSNVATLSLLEDAVKSEELSYFKRNNNAVSFNILQKLHQIILGLKEDGITPESMASELIQRQNILSADIRFEEITRIYTRYNKLLADKYLDEPSIYTRLVNVVECGSASLNNLSFLQADSIILFNGFNEFKLPEAKFVALFTTVNTPTLINIDYSPIFGPRIESLPANVRRLVGEGHNQQIKLEHKQNILPSEHLRNWLYDDSINLKNEDLLRQIKIYEATDRLSEVKNIAKLAIHLNTEHGIAFDEMCVCARQPHLYTDLFRELFSESGIIVNVSDRFNLSNASPIVLVFALLDIILKRWRRVDIERVIYFNEIKQAFPDIEKLVNFSNKYHIVGGLGVNHWRKVFDKYLEICEDESDILDLPKIISSFNKLKSILDFQTHYDTYRQFVDDINDKIINKLKLREHIYLQYNSIVKEQLDKCEYNNFSIATFQLIEEIEKNGVALSQFIKLLYELADIEEDKCNTGGISLKEAVDKLKIVCSGTKFQIEEKESLGINITSIEQTRGIPYKVMILCGAVDGEFPLFFKTDKFLGKELPNSEKIHNDNEKILFYQFLTNNIKLLDAGKMNIYIFYPASDKTKNMIRSAFIDDICQIVHKDDLLNYVSKLSNEEYTALDNKTSASWMHYTVQNMDILLQIASDTAQLTDNYLIIKNKIEYYKKYYNESLLTPSVQTDKLVCNTDKIIDRKLKDSEYSITQLETYAGCTLRYFYKYILQIKTEQEISDYIVLPVEIGSYLHKILEIFYKQNLQRTINKTFDIKIYNDLVLNELYEIVDNITSNISFNFMKYEAIKLKNLIKWWYNNEIEKHKNGWLYSSAKFELEFNNAGKKYVTLSNSNGDTIKLKGRIDRVEINEADKTFIAADYKLGRAGISKISDIENGTALQIPIYLLVAKSMLNNEYKPHNGVYYLLKSNPKKPFVTWGIKPKYNKDSYSQGQIDEILNNSLECAINHKKNIEDLVLKYPENCKNVCIYCEYKKHCNVIERKHITHWE